MFTENSSCSELSKISSTSSPYHQSLNKRSWYWVIFSHPASRRSLHRWNTTVYFCREITKLIKFNQMHPDIHLHWLKDTILHGLFKILKKADFDWPYAIECQMSRGHRIKIGLSDSLVVLSCQQDQGLGKSTSMLSLSVSGLQHKQFIKLWSPQADCKVEIKSKSCQTKGLSLSLNIIQASHR